MDTTLTAAEVLRERATPEGRARLMAAMASRLYDQARRVCRNEDTPGDFLVYMYPRLERLIDRYQDKGMPFEHYLNSVVAWNLRSFHRTQREQARAWDDARRADLWEKPEARTPPDPIRPPQTKPGRLKLAILALRASGWLAPEQLAAAAEAAGRPDLPAAVERLRAARAHAEARAEKLRRSRDLAWGNMLRLEAEAARTTDPAARARIAAAIQRRRAGWRRARVRLAKVQTPPTQREIAAALGIPAGTVSTCMRVSTARGALA